MIKRQIISIVLIPLLYISLLSNVLAYDNTSGYIIGDNGNENDTEINVTEPVEKIVINNAKVTETISVADTTNKNKEKSPGFESIIGIISIISVIYLFRKKF